METVDELNLTEILTALQDFMTQDGAISGEQRSFYQAFRGHLNAHEGVFKLEDVERLLLEAKNEVPEISEEEFTDMGEAILTHYRAKNADALNERIRLLAEEEARKQALAESERAAREEENRLRAEEEERRLAEEAEAERLRLEEEERLRQAEEAERLRLEEEERQRQAEEAERLRLEEEERQRQAEEAERLRLEEEERQRQAEEAERLRLEEEERQRQAEEAERLRLEEEERLRQAEEAERLRLEEEERQRQAEEARLQAELEAEAAAKQAYWDAQEALPGEEAKVVPDLPTDAQIPAGEDTSSNPLLPKLVAGVVLLGALIGMGLVLF
jgi:hypothetical protein